MGRFRAGGQSKDEVLRTGRHFAEHVHPVVAAACDDGGTAASAEEWFVEIQDDRDEAPPLRGSRLFPQVTDAGELVPIRPGRRGLEGGRGWPPLRELRERLPGEGE